MIFLKRPAAAEALDRTTRSALAKRQARASGFAKDDRRIGLAWSSFLKSNTKVRVASALDDLSRRKCAYCEGVAAQDIEHFYPKSLYPKKMFRWPNFLKGCKNCNNFKVAKFPLAADGRRLLINPAADDPLEYFVWDFETGFMAARPDPGFRERADETQRMFRLNVEPLREERRAKVELILYLLARVVAENPLTKETQARLQDQLDHNRPWLGIIRQLLHCPGPKYDKLLAAAKAKLPAIYLWIAPWV